MSASAVVSRTADLDAADVELVASVRAGDDRAFEALYRRYQGRITAYVRGMVRDHGRAEDITQEVFMSALRRMRGTEAAIVFKPWIYEIAKNACIDAWRRSRNTNEISIDAQDALGADDHGRLADPRLTPDSVVDNKDAIDNLCGAFGGLSATHHEILVMREFEGLSYREIGERLGMSRPGVESTLFRARRRLSEEYEELVSGERCVRVQRIIDSPGGRPGGLRDQRRMARHLAHCQPCRRYARLAGVDLDVAASRPAAVAARIAAWFPLPLFARRRWGGGEELVGHAHHGPVAQWSASVASTLDPGVVSGWSKAAATAATVAVASLGAGAAIHERHAIKQFVGGSTPAARHAAPHGAGAAAGASRAAAASAARAAAAARRASGTGADERAGARSREIVDPGAPQRAGSPAAPGAGVPVEGRRHSIAAGDAPGGAGVAAPTGVRPDPAGRAGATVGKLDDGPVAAAPGPTSAGVPAGQTLDQALGGLGSAGTGATGGAPAASATTTAPEQPLGDAVTQVGGGALGGLTTPAPPAGSATTSTTTARSPAPSSSPGATVTAVVDSVSTTLSGTLASTTPGRAAP